MGLQKNKFSNAIMRKLPSSVGAMSAILRLRTAAFNNGSDTDGSPSGKLDLALEKISEYTAIFEYPGIYHDLPHHEHTVNLGHKIVSDYHLNNPDKVDPRNFQFMEIFGRGHDAIHFGYGPRDTFTLNVITIANLYGIDSNNKSILQDILDATNFGLIEDNLINYGFEEHSKKNHQKYLKEGGDPEKYKPRKLVTSFDENIEYSEEEFSALIIDSIMFEAGCTLEERLIVWGIIQASEFARSTPFNNRPGFKTPRTQLELFGKLADMGNFCDSIKEWVEVSCLINSEVSWFNGKDVMSFIREELSFINGHILPLLDTKIANVKSGANQNVDSTYIPEFFKTAVREKALFLNRMQTEIDTAIIYGAISPEGEFNLDSYEFSDEFKEFVAGIRGSLLKPVNRFDPEQAEEAAKLLADESVKTPIASAEYIESVIVANTTAIEAEDNRIRAITPLDLP